MGGLNTVSRAVCNARQQSNGEPYHWGEPSDRLQCSLPVSQACSLLPARVPPCDQPPSSAAVSCDQSLQRNISAGLYSAVSARRDKMRSETACGILCQETTLVDRIAERRLLVRACIKNGKRTAASKSITLLYQWEKKPRKTTEEWMTM